MWPLRHAVDRGGQTSEVVCPAGVPLNVGREVLHDVGIQQLAYESCQRAADSLQSLCGEG